MAAGASEASNKPGATAAMKIRVPARVFALEAEDTDKEVSVLEGMFSISGQVFKVLVDPGSTHSFINPSYSEKRGINVEILPYWVEVGTPMGKPGIRTDRICKGCQVTIKERMFPVNLVVLPLRGYEVILGMDWLSCHYAQINCRTKELSFAIPESSDLKCTLKSVTRVPKLISGEKARKFLLKGAVGYLASLVVQTGNKRSLEQVEVVKEFKDVFPDELSTAPPDRKIEFTIDLVPRVEPISRTSYKMAPVELQELKAQLQELLGQGFIRPSTSPWGAPVLFVKKKDRTLRMCIDYRGLNN
ncbi:retroviral-like aspartic protease family protein, partial [Candidatus Burkholderia verschuerenii]|uniref:retroviral-like aspartic protease family protein n=1 Tax=Candidatus Burkholderia verschuerenii TaxID=242163 RepID=UPI0012ECEAB5